MFNGCIILDLGGERERENERARKYFVSNITPLVIVYTTLY